VVAVEVHGVARQEQVARVAIDLRALVRLEGVLDGHGMQVELAGQPGEVVGRRVHEVDPDDRVGLGESLGHVREREVLGVEDPGPVAPGAHVAHAHQ
jgi:hypothetical protein